MKKAIILGVILMLPSMVIGGGDIDLTGYSNTDSVGIVSERSRGHFIAKDKILSGDILFYINAKGYDGSNFIGPHASIRFNANQDWSTTAAGTNLTFHATADDSTTLTKIATLSDIGMFTVHSSTEAFQFGEASLDVDSSPSAAGILAVNSSYELYISTGTGVSAWVKVGGQ